MYKLDIPIESYVDIDPIVSLGTTHCEHCTNTHKYKLSELENALLEGTPIRYWTGGENSTERTLSPVLINDIIHKVRKLVCVKHAPTQD